jgi:hypothetical protein
MRIDARPRRRATGWRAQATLALGLGLGLLLPASVANADPGDPPAVPPAAESGDSREGVAQPAQRSRPEPRPAPAKSRAKDTFQPSEKIPADVPSHLPTDI